MRNVELLKEAFSTCFVNNGIIRFMKSYSPELMMELYSSFTEDLLNCNIPHWRVIGFYHQWDDKHGKSVFRCNDNYNQSLIELAHNMRFIIPEQNGGISLEDGCFYGEAEEVENLPEFDEAFGWSPSMRAGTKKANMLKVPRDQIGSLMVAYEYGDPSIPVNELTTSNLWYTQFSLVQEIKHPNVLIPNKKISDLVKGEMGDPLTFMFIKEGVGRLSYEDTQSLFKDNWEYLMPCDVAYDLSEYITVQYPDGSANEMKLVYWEEINEDVLTTILQNYGRRL